MSVSTMQQQVKHHREEFKMNLDDLYRMLRSGHIQAQGIVDSIDEPIVVLDGTCTVIEANCSFFSTFLAEREDTIGSTLFDLGDGQWNIPELHTLLREIIPRSAALVDYEVQHVFPSIGDRTFLLNAKRLSRPDHNSPHLLLVFTDVTARRNADREASALNSELRHRMMNLLGVVQAIANRIDTNDRSADYYKAAFLQRLSALSKAQSLLNRRTDQIDLSSLTAALLNDWCGDTLSTAGPHVLLSEQQVLPLTMILTELATNSFRYGALGPLGGQAALRWTLSQIEGLPSLRVVWKETCEASPDPPGKGTGTDIVQQIAKYSLHGNALVEFEKDGLRATLAFPTAACADE